jgi:DNA-binding NarL/FixJ family response regulator
MNAPTHLPMSLLLVDDHTLFREGLAFLLRPLVEGITTREAGSCEEALQNLQEHGPADMVLMDLGLPGMSGLQGIATLRQQWPAMPVVALSSSDDRDTVLKAVDAGAMGFIPKSATSAVLIAALKLILARGIYLPPSAFLGAAGRDASALPFHPAAKAAPQIRAAAPAEGVDSNLISNPESALGSNVRSGVHSDSKCAADLGLSPRQSEVLYLILQGKPAKLIEREMTLSAGTVKAHTSAVLRALNVTTRTQAVVAAGRLGLRF